MTESRERPMIHPGNSAHARNASAGCNRCSLESDEISLFAISTSKPGKATVMDTNNRAMGSIEGALAGEYWGASKPTLARPVSAIARRSELIARSGFSFSTVVVGVAYIGVSIDMLSVEHTKSRRARMSFRNFPAINSVVDGVEMLYGSPLVLGVTPTPRA